MEKIKKLLKKSKTKLFFKILVISITIITIFILPNIIIHQTTKKNIFKKINNIPQSDIIIIFGTLIDDSGTISPLLLERLEAGKTLLKNTKGKKIVVSNTEHGANVMKKYLVKNGVKEKNIEVDNQANTTLDTCKFEKKEHNTQRKVIFISQGYHLPRLIFQCQKIGINGNAYPAENINITDKSQYPFLLKMRVRSWRFIRESFLIWMSVLGVYK